MPEMQQMCKELEVNNNLAPHKGNQVTLPFQNFPVAFPVAFQNIFFFNHLLSVERKVSGNPHFN